MSDKSRFRESPKKKNPKKITIDKEKKGYNLIKLIIDRFAQIRRSSSPFQGIALISGFK